MIIINIGVICIYYTIKDMPYSERPRERLKSVGVENLTDRELLAIILKTGTKNFNVGDVALEILKKYSIYELNDLTINELIKIRGIGEVKAIELLSAIELGKRIYVRSSKSLKRLTNAKDIWKDMRYLFINKKQEMFYCLYFNNKQELIERKLLFMGTINKSITHPREVFREAYRVSASSIVCLHNHPSGDVCPSREDIMFTEALVRIGNLQGIPVVDHIIVSDDTFYSFYEHKNILNI